MTELDSLAFDSQRCICKPVKIVFMKRIESSWKDASKFSVLGYMFDFDLSWVGVYEFQLLKQRRTIVKLALINAIMSDREKCVYGLAMLTINLNHFASKSLVLSMKIFNRWYLAW